MIDPMIARLGGCLVFAGLFAALLAVVATQDGPDRRDVVAAAEVHHRVASSLFARP